MAAKKSLIAIAAAMALATSTFASPANAGNLDQYANSASATSNYSGYEAAKATGSPDVTYCHDDSNAWASATRAGDDQLTLGFATAVIPSQLKVWTTLDPATLTKVEVAGSNNVWTTVYTRAYADAITSGADCTAVPAPHTITTALVTGSGHSWPTTAVNQVRLSFDQATGFIPYGGETDAVQLTGATTAAAALKTAAKVSGTAKVGKKLTLSTGTFTGTPAATKTIKWYACSKAVTKATTKAASGCKAISGVTSSSLTLKSAQKGKYIAALVTANNGVGSAATSFTKSTSKVS